MDGRLPITHVFLLAVDDHGVVGHLLAPNYFRVASADDLHPDLLRAHHYIDAQRSQMIL